MGREPVFCMIVPLGGDIGGIGGIDPGFGNRPIHHPGHPDHGLSSQPGHPSQPIYHPGHPDHGLPPFPSQGLPGQGGGRPDQGLPPFPSQGLPPGGTDIPSNELPMPEPPPDHSDDIIVAVHRPGEEWVVKAYEADTHPDQGLPPTPEPKSRHRR